MPELLQTPRGVVDRGRRRGSIEPGMAVTSASVPPVIGATGGFGP